MDRFQLAIVVHRYKPHVEDIFLAQRCRERDGGAQREQDGHHFICVPADRVPTATPPRNTGQWSDLLARSTCFRFAAAVSQATHTLVLKIKSSCPVHAVREYLLKFATVLCLVVRTVRENKSWRRRYPYVRAGAVFSGSDSKEGSTPFPPLRVSLPRPEVPPPPSPPTTSSACRPHHSFRPVWQTRMRRGVRQRR